MSMSEARASMDRAEKLLALLLLQNMKGAPQKDKAVQLSLAGFSYVEIADLLQTSAATIGQYMYEVRKSKKRKNT